MAFAPVTNAEYRCFIEADGYKDERWWVGETSHRWRREGLRNEKAISDWRYWIAALRNDFDTALQRYFPTATSAQIEGQLRRYAALPEAEAESILERYYCARVRHEPIEWQNMTFNSAGQPVVGLSWFEAQAYCRWLRAQSNQGINLPTEAEWEAACRGLDARKWAWCREDHVVGMNNDDTAHLLRTSPIGVFVASDSPEGLSDLGGNVLEWTASLYTSVMNLDALTREAPDGVAPRALRGGSWSSTVDSCRAGCRSYTTADIPFNYLGFRMMRRSIR